MHQTIEAHKFYVSVKNGKQWRALLGPYDTHAEAEANKQRGRQLAEERDYRACWYAYGTCSHPESEPDLPTLFGK